jgi:integrase/recombinase XerD
MNTTDLTPQIAATLVGSVLEPYVAEYRSKLESIRYAANTRYVYAGCIGHFARWLTAERIGLEGVNEEAGRCFINVHLPRCNCPPPSRRSPSDIKAALSHLFDVLRAPGALSAPSGSADHIRSELAAFDQYMDAVCGLVAKSRRQRVLFLARFLTARFRSGPITATAITATDLRQFVLGSQAPHSPGLVGVMANALRCYLHFRALAGDPVESLIGMIPRPARRQLATIPVALSKSEVKQLLGSFDESLPSMRRAYAMVRCLADLGLRAGEVAHLHLDDIDWHAGTLRLARGKSRRADVLPLPAETGRAIAEYLHMERPPTANRAVFVRHVAPYDKPIGVGVVISTVNCNPSRAAKLT